MLVVGSHSPRYLYFPTLVTSSLNSQGSESSCQKAGASPSFLYQSIISYCTSGNNNSFAFYVISACRVGSSNEDFISFIVSEISFSAYCNLSLKNLISLFAVILKFYNSYSLEVMSAS